jgi:hypothetical protein
VIGVVGCGLWVEYTSVFVAWDGKKVSSLDAANNILIVIS